MKRSDYITWDQYFMGIAIMSANRSKDPNTQVGACWRYVARFPLLCNLVPVQ